MCVARTTDGPLANNWVAAEVNRVDTDHDFEFYFNLCGGLTRCALFCVCFSHSRL